MKVLCEKCGALAEGRLEARPGGGAAVACGACGAEVPLATPEGAQRLPAQVRASTAPPTPTSTPPPTSTEAATAVPATTDDEAWTAVVARWDDEEAHRAFLTRFADLEGLAGAGRRYRQALSERPGDAVALRWRDEVLKRATVQGLMQLPRTSAPRASPKLVRWAVLAGMVGASALAAGWMVWRLLALARS